MIRYVKNKETIMEKTIEIKQVIENTKAIIKSGNFPNHDAFGISAIVGAAINVPKEEILDAMLKSN